PITALSEHVTALGRERERLSRQIAAVTATITRLQAGEPLMAEEMFDGFDHRQYEEEVTARWGGGASRRSDEWWSGLSAQQRRDFRAEVAALRRGWSAAAADGEGPESPRCRELARRHIAWLSRTPGTRAADPDGDLRGYFTGLA